MKKPRENDDLLYDIIDFVQEHKWKSDNEIVSLVKDKFNLSDEKAFTYTDFAIWELSHKIL